MLFLVFLLLPSSFADYGRCTAWEKDTTFYCYFVDKKAEIWTRDCSHYLDITQLCTLQNPNTYKNSCSTWVPHQGFKCIIDGRLKKQWLRTCSVIGRQTEYCDDRVDPNDLDL